MEESALVNKAEKYLKKISNDPIILDDIEDFENLEWKNFKGEQWKNEINVSAFIDENYKEYTGDDSFLKGKTDKTKNIKYFIFLTPLL